MSKPRVPNAGKIAALFHRLAARFTAMSNLTSAPECRVGCGACCIAPSISSAIPGMPHGKPAGVRCIQLDEANRCRLFGSPERPAVCGSLKPSHDMCGNDDRHAMIFLARLESLTAVQDDI